jgi:hypothetical protein
MSIVDNKQVMRLTEASAASSAALTLGGKNVGNQ